jgi:DNA (cytosine-5)-methyltransferase 1
VEFSKSLTVNELALFAGAGGGILGGKLLGWTTVGAVEIDPFGASVLLARQRDRLLPPFPIWDDARAFDGHPWRGVARVVSAGFPCQDISTGNSSAEGISGARSGLWKHTARIIGEVRPSFSLLENSSQLTRKGLEVVLGDLAEMGYDARWGVLHASHAGASHERKRIWIVASDPNQVGPQGGYDERHVEQGEAAQRLHALLDPSPFPKDRDDLPVPYAIGGRDGVPNALDRVAAIGNAQVPAVVKLAWEILAGK